MDLPNVTPEMRAVMDETALQVARGEMVPPRVAWWWERRRDDEMTPEYLGRVLDAVPAPELAARARLGHFDDFHAPADVADGLELIHLVVELRRVRGGSPLGSRCRAVENAVMHGEFDATKAESDRWAASNGGQDVFAELVWGAAKMREQRERGERRADPVGRNDPCPCGSGAKYKRCCGR